METTIWVTVLTAAVTAGTPILYAALGELLCERSGNLNLGVEGMMLVGAMSGFSVGVSTGNPWLGLVVGMLGGGLLALVHAFLTISLRANQVVSGLALTLFGTGLSAYLGQAMVGIPFAHSFKNIPIPGLSQIPFLGPIFFNHDAMVYLSYLLVPFLWFYIYKTRWGLKLRAVGENPAAADAMGVHVFLVRYIHVIAGGMLAGAGGAYLSLAYSPAWLENMTAGRGWIAVALVIFALWDPFRALVGSYIFGGLDVLGFRMQAYGISVSPYFLRMLPYIFTVVVLVLVTIGYRKKRIGAPGALGIPYDREER